MSHAYTEDQLVERPAIGLFAELGWPTVSALEETFGATGMLLRETKGEVVLVSRLRTALERLNAGRLGHHALPSEAIIAAVDELTRDRSAMSLEAANREVYRLLKEGIPVSVAEKDSTSVRAELPLRPNVPGGAATPPYQKGGQTTVRVRVIDWEHPANNDFLLVSQFSVTGALYTCRPDLVGFVNGLPLVVIELKKPGVPARAAFDANLTHYKERIDTSPLIPLPIRCGEGDAVLVQRAAHRLERQGQPRRITHGGLGAVLRGPGRTGIQRIARADAPRRVSLEMMLRGTCGRAWLLDLV